MTELERMYQVLVELCVIIGESKKATSFIQIVKSKKLSKITHFSNVTYAFDFQTFDYTE